MTNPALAVIQGNSTPSIALGTASIGYRGYIKSINATAHDLERRLLEIGFIEGTPVEILHQGAFFHDPIAVRLGTITIALRRREAMAVFVTGI